MPTGYDAPRWDRLDRAMHGVELAIIATLFMCATAFLLLILVAVASDDWGWKW